MSDSEILPKVKADGKGNILKQAEIDYMKLIEQKNLERVQKLKRIRRNNIITGSALGVFVCSIYAYSILAIKQERFLDDFEVPEKVKKY